MSDEGEAPTYVGEGDWRITFAEEWAQTVVRGLTTEFPYASQHLARTADDVDVTPRRLFPVFHSCYDWHSSAHMQWSGIRLLSEAGEYLTAETRRALVEQFDQRMTTDNAATEVAYLRARPGFERPYGWAWAAMLTERVVAASRSGALPEAAAWVECVASIAAAVADNLLNALGRMSYPVRHGVHSNTAFALSLAHQAYGRMGRPEVVRATEDRARLWYLRDRRAPVHWEPSGEDFLSPSLCEADLMRRVLGPDEFAPWLAEFLPDLGDAGDPLMDTPVVGDPGDGRMVHLYGLGLSRAWQLRLLAPHLGSSAGKRVLEAAQRQFAAVQSQVSGASFVSTHWLVSFALLASDPGA